MDTLLTLTFSMAPQCLCFTAGTCLIHTPHYYRQFALSLGKGSGYTFSKFDLLKTDTPLMRTLSVAPSVSTLGGCDCK